MADDAPRRCQWGMDPTMVEYHDREWGVPSHDDRHLFEMLTLESAQSGLSWRTILLRREGYRRAFAGWDLGRIATYDESTVATLLEDPGIIRHRGKIAATIGNAQAALDVIAEEGSLDAFLWSFVGGRPIVTDATAEHDVPAETVESQAMSKELKRRGFRFLGPTTCYAFMQAAGLVNDHVQGCFRRDQV